MIDRKRLRELCEAATPGPWMQSDIVLGDHVSLGARVIDTSDDPIREQVADCCDGTAHGDPECVANAAFIAEARTAIPALLDALDAADESLKASEQARDENLECVRAMAEVQAKSRARMFALEADLAAERRARATTQASLDAAWAHPSFKAMQADRDRLAAELVAADEHCTKPSLCTKCDQRYAVAPDEYSCDECGGLVVDVSEAVRIIGLKEARIAALETVAVYARHTDPCVRRAQGKPSGGCTCDLDAARKAAGL